MRIASLCGAIGFLALAAVAFVATGLLTGGALGLLGLTSGGTAGAWCYSATFTVLLLGATWLSLQREGASFASLGLAPTRRRGAELGLGFAAGALLFGGVALVQAASVGASWEFAGAAGLRAAVEGLPLTLALLLPEELLFRGYAFRRLADGSGSRVALVVSACAFGLYHVVGTGNWAMGAVFQFAMPALGGLVFGYAALKTRGLALPIGLHLGGNWVQANVLGFGVQTDGPAFALWRAALTPEQVRALVAPDLVPHLPYLLGLATLVLVLVLVRHETSHG